MHPIEQPVGVTETDDIEGFLRLESRRRRRSFIIAGSITALIVAAAVVFFATRSSNDIDRELAGKIRAAIPHIHGDEAGFAAQALSELEARRLPKPMLKALEKAASGGPYASMALAEALVDPALVPVWKRACPAGPRALADGLQSGAGADVCGACPQACAKLGGKLYGHPAAVAFSLLAADALAQHGSLHSVEVELLQMLAQ